MSSVQGWALSCGANQQAPPVRQWPRRLGQASAPSGDSHWKKHQIELASPPTSPGEQQRKITAIGRGDHVFA